MTSYDFSPLYRSTIGFDRLIETLGHDMGSDWPPYDIEKTGERDYRISMAVPGFAPDDLELMTVEGSLTVTGRKPATEAGALHYLHRGIASRSFKQSFDLADHLKVVSAQLVNGLLTIDLVRELPEARKPRRIDIGTQGATPQAPPSIGQSQAA